MWSTLPPTSAHHTQLRHNTHSTVDILPPCNHCNALVVVFGFISIIHSVFSQFITTCALLESKGDCTRMLSYTHTDNTLFPACRILLSVWCWLYVTWLGDFRWLPMTGRIMSMTSVSMVMTFLVTTSQTMHTLFGNP